MAGADSVRVTRGHRCVQGVLKRLQRSAFLTGARYEGRPPKGTASWERLYRGGDVALGKKVLALLFLFTTFV